MATVRKRKWTHNGKDAEAWVVNYSDQAGKRRQETFEKKKDADRRRVEIEGEIQKGIHVANGATVSFATAVDEFMREYERRQRIGDLSLGCLKNYRLRLVKHGAGYFGLRKLNEIQSRDVQLFVDDLRLKLAPNTVIGVYSTIYTLLDFAVSRRWLVRNVLRDNKIRLPAKVKRDKVPSREDIDRLLIAASEIPAEKQLLTALNMKLAVVLGVFSGLRPGESFGLHWEDVDFSKQTILIAHSSSTLEGIKKPKTEAGVRTVPLTAPIIEALEDIATYWTIREQVEKTDAPRSGVNQRIQRLWRDRAKHNILLPPRRGLVIVSRNGIPLNSESAYGAWCGLMVKAGFMKSERGQLPPFTLHALRHAAVSLMIAEGVPLMHLPKVIGHKNIRTTLDVYAYLIDETDYVSASANRIAASFNATRVQQVAVTI